VLLYAAGLILVTTATVASHNYTIPRQ
jgi:hypothetical protein